MGRWHDCAFNQDMIFRRAVQVDWNNIQNERQKTLAASNAKEKKIQKLIVLDPDERRSHPKMSKPTKGPYAITRIHTNGTVDINRGNFIETINIRRLKPFITM